MVVKFLRSTARWRVAAFAVTAIAIAGCSSQGDSASPETATETTVAVDDTAAQVDEGTSITVPTEVDGSDIQVSTTADPEDEAAINAAGEQIVDAWWFGDSTETYNDLADDLEGQGLITSKFASEWREEGDRQVEDLTLTVEVVTMGSVRAESDNATFQIASIKDGEDETVTYLEFVLDGGEWKLDEVAA